MKNHTWNNNQTHEAKGKRSSVDPKVFKCSMFYSLGREQNLTPGFFQTNPWTLMPTTSLQEPTITHIVLSLTPMESFSLFFIRKDAFSWGKMLGGRRVWILSRISYNFTIENQASLVLLGLIWHSWEAWRRLQHSKLHTVTSPFPSQHHCVPHPSSTHGQALFS